MQSKADISICMILLLIVLINLLEIGRGQQQNPFSCTSNGNYTSNSTYSANLNALLDSLNSNMSDYGFYNSSLGNNQDRAYAFALCRADQTPDQCHACVERASREIRQVCPNQRQAVLYYESCTLRYSNNPTHNLSGALEGRMLVNTATASNAVYFKEDVLILLVDLRVQASGGSSELKAGAGTRNVSGSLLAQLYGLVQCTPDLSLEDCRQCLEKLSNDRSKVDDFTRGIRVLTPNCKIRYELYSFYNETRLRELRILQPLPPSPSPGRSDDDDTKVVISVVVPIGVCLIVVAFVAIVLRRRMKRKKHEITHTADHEINSVESLQYDFGIIRAATGDFGDVNKLGRGGFGAVYWGKLVDGQEIAAKRLSKDSGQGDTEFKNEVLLVARLQHRNLVRLLGFSIERTERILVYEFVQNASLDKFIFDPVRRSELGWDTRYKIICGVARGILYLHEDSRLRIIHRDLKASNVLLDGDMNPKIADFGMARLFRQDETQGNTQRIVGTYGYMSPEYAMHGQFSIKSDVFSFGVLILEIISGRRNNVIRHGENVENLLTLTWENWQEGTMGNVIDPVIANNTGSVGEMLRCLHLGLLCVQENAANRPTMTTVVSMLNSSTTSTFPLPLEPAFYKASHYGPQVPLMEEFDSKSSLNGGGASLNNMSLITELNPRSCRMHKIHRFSHVVVVIALYAASAEDLLTEVSILDFHEINELPKYIV